MKAAACTAVGINVDSMPDSEFELLELEVAPPEPALEVSVDFHSSATLSVGRNTNCLPSCSEIATRFKRVLSLFAATIISN